MTRLIPTHVAVLIVLVPTIAAAQNLIANGDFTADVRHWQAAGDSNVVTQTLKAVKDADGKPVAQLVCTRCDRQTPAGHAMLAQVGVVQLTKGKTYEFSCRARAINLAGRSVSVAITDTKVWENCGLQTQLALSGAWQSYRRVFRATRSVGQSSRLQIWYNEPGTLEIADVRLVEIRAEEVVFTDTVPPASGKNLIVNGSFEAGPMGWLSMGVGVGWGDLDRLHGRIESAGGRHGRSFLRIPLGDAETPVLYFDYFEPVVRRELRPLAASRGWIAVEPDAAYTLSCCMRASREGTPAVLGIRAKDSMGGSRDHSLPLTLTTAWNRYSITFRPQQRFMFVYMGPQLKDEQRVDVDVDAVQLEKAESATEFAPRAELEFSVEPAAEGGIFRDDEQPRLLIRGVNHGATPAQLPVTFRATDFADNPAELPQQVLDIPARSTLLRELKLPADWRGYYRIIASTRIGQRIESTDLRLAIVPRRIEKDSVLGINHAFVSGNLIHLAAKAGVTWYRDWSLKWQHIEPRPGEFHWDIADTQIDRVLREGPFVLPMLPPFPSADWASEAPANLPTQGYPGARLRQAWAPKNPADLGAFVEKSVARYKDRIRVWEFLNEPIYTDYSLPADSTNRYGGRKYTPADYVALLKTASVAMRKSDPACKVIGGIGSGPKHLTQDVIDAGILAHIDILNLHMYPGLRAPESYLGEMTDLLKRMDTQGSRKPIWITEFSYYGADDLPRRPFFPSSSDWAEERLLDSERQCADYTVRYFAVMLSRGVQKIFIHSGASSRVNDPNFECALFAAAGSPRKLFPALAVFTNLLGPAPTFAGEARWPDSTHIFAFETPNRAILILYQTDPAPSKLAFPNRADLTWLDPMGRKLTTPQLSTSPIYLLSPAGTAKQLLDTLSPP